MKNLLLLIGFLSSSVVFSQNINYKDGLYTENNQPYTGKHNLLYASGSIKEELNISEGKLNGEIIRYHENGQKMETGYYEAGLKAGTWFRFNSSGIKVAEASYKNDKKDGLWMVYGDNGEKLFKMEYKNGEKTGTWFQWNENGEVVKSTNFASL